MKYKIYGDTGKRILIIHGWVNSSKIYIKLARKLSRQFQVTLVDLPGFGQSKPIFSEDIIGSYAKIIKKILIRNEYDLIIGHSMGGNIILRAIDNNEVYKNKVLLLNPAYYETNKFKAFAYSRKFIEAIGKLIHILPSKIINPIIKVFLLVSVNKYKLIDKNLVDGVIQTNPKVASKTMHELAFSKWRINKINNENITIIMSEHDRIIRKAEIQLLCNDLENYKLKMYYRIGHTPVIEAFNRLYYDIINIITD